MIDDNYVPCPSCLEKGLISGNDYLFYSYEMYIMARECQLCKGEGKLLREPHEVFE